MQQENTVLKEVLVFVLIKLPLANSCEQYGLPFEIL